LPGNPCGPIEKPLFFNGLRQETELPRLIKDKKCPHCGVALRDPIPRVCPECAGSLQQRYLRAGCLSTGPGLFLLGWLALHWLGGA